MEAPVEVHGNYSRAIMVEVNDSNGDLVDVEYYCFWPCQDEAGFTMGEALLWPAYSWPDYTVNCNRCGELINKGNEDGD